MNFNSFRTGRPHKFGAQMLGILEILDRNSQNPATKLQGFNEIAECRDRI